jgi:hypothetical protein
MMTTPSTKLLGLLLAGVVFGVFGCVLEEKVVEVVVTGETCADYNESHDSVNWNTPVTIDYAQKIDEILDDHDVDRSDIVMARVKGATYTVTTFSHIHDWEVSGAITIKRENPVDGPEVLVTYASQSLQDALGVEVPAVLDSEGVRILNEALQDYIDGASPQITFEVVNDGVTPTPSAEDRIVFHWEACIQLHIVVSQDVELPDVF